MNKPEKVQINSESNFQLSSNNEISRRQFLKISSVTFLSVVAGNIPALSRTPRIVRSWQAPSSSDIEIALKIAEESPMYKEALEALNSSEFEFTIVKDGVVNSLNMDNFIGLVLHHSQSVSNRFGADLIFTVDLKNSVLNRIQTIIGWSLVDTLEIASSEFDVRIPLYPEFREERVIYDTPPEMRRPRIEHQWSFWRPDSPSITPDDLVLNGWPVEKSDSHYWYFDGCSVANWMNEGGMWVFRCEQVAEHQSDDPKNQRSLELKYLEQE